MATLQTWVDATRRLLLSGKQEERNTLSAPYTPGAGTLTFTNPLGGIVPGVRLSIGLNTFYVSAVANNSLSATVIGGQDGSTDAAAPAGALVWVVPRFTDFEIVDALAGDLGDLSAPGNGLFRIGFVDLAADTATFGYDLTGLTDFIDLYDVRAALPGAGGSWAQLDRNTYRLDRAADTDAFPSGLSLQFFQAATLTGYRIRVMYRRGFTVPTALTDDLTLTGLPATAWDIPPMGAAMRLVVPREIHRNTTQGQGDTRRAAEVPAGAIASSLRPLATLRAQRIAAEAGRLLAQYPDRRR